MTDEKPDLENTLYLDLKDGRVEIKLLPDVAPKHVERIKHLAREGFYDGIIFHRVIDGFMAQTGDPTGAYFVYEFVMPNMKLNDYAKFGVWRDGYYMSTEQFVGSDFAGIGVFAFDRAKMLAGDASASFIYFDLPAASAVRLGNLLPADLDGLNPPGAGAPNTFVGYEATEYGDAQDASVNADHGTVVGAVATADRFGAAGKAMRFATPGDRLEVAATEHPQGEVSVTSAEGTTTFVVRLPKLAPSQPATRHAPGTGPSQLQLTPPGS